MAVRYLDTIFRQSQTLSIVAYSMFVCLTVNDAVKGAMINPLKEMEFLKRICQPSQRSHAAGW